jgi:hypothetical protein
MRSANVQPPTKQLAITDLAYKLRAAERYYRAVLAAIDGPAENIEGFDHRDELRAYDAKLEAEAALYDAIDKAGAL